MTCNFEGTEHFPLKLFILYVVFYHNCLVKKTACFRIIFCLKQTVFYISLLPSASTAARQTGFLHLDVFFTIAGGYPGSGGGLWRRAFLRSSHRFGTCRRAGDRKFCTGTDGFRIPDPGFCHPETSLRCIRTWFCRCLPRSFRGADIFCRFLWMRPWFILVQYAGRYMPEW